jgi:chromosomal replication initiation ATPase DnaA
MDKMRSRLNALLRYIGNEMEGQRAYEEILRDVDRKLTHLIVDIDIMPIQHSPRAIPISTKAISYGDISRVFDLMHSRYNLTPGELRGPRRTKRFADVRHIAMWLVHKANALTLTDIGRLFGNRDHSTVLHAVNKINAARINNEHLAADLDGLLEELYGTTEAA